MPEQLKPCPACNNTGTIIHMGLIAETKMWFVECDDDNCAHHGKACFTEAAAIAAWNSLPRALTWTTEPPTVAGWYWCRLSKLNMPRCVEVYGAWDQLMFGSKRDDYNPQMPVTREGFEWAGPIQAPGE